MILKRISLRLFIIFMFTGLISQVKPVAAQSGVVLTAHAGLDGTCRQGYWMPVRVRLENTGEPVEGQVEASLPPTSPAQPVYVYPVSLPSQSHKEVTLYFLPSSYTSSIQVSLTSGGKVLTSATLNVDCISKSDLLFGVLAGSMTVYNQLAELDPPNGSAYVARLDMQDIPERADALRSLNYLVIADVDTGALTKAQQEALQSWVYQGGVLIIAGGPGWQATIAGLQGLLPFIPSGLQNLDHLGSVQQYSQSADALEAGQSPIPVNLGRLADGAMALVTQQELPLVARRLQGYGQVIYLAFDPGSPPLSSWDGLQSFFAQLLSYQVDRPGWSFGIQNDYSVPNAAQNIPNLELPSTLGTCVFLGFYVAVLGPLNYVALRRFKKREWAWVSIPLLVAIFSLASIVIGNLWRGRSPILNEMAVIQVWPGSPKASLAGVVGIYSPNRSTYQAAFGADLLARPIQDTFLPVSDFPAVVEGSDSIRIHDLRVDVGGVYSLVIEGQVPAPAITSDLVISISRSGAILQGQISNNSPLTLEDAALLYPGGAQSLGSLAPGEVQQVSIPLVQPQYASLGVVYNPIRSPLMMPGTGINYPVYANSYFDPTATDIIGSANVYDDPQAFHRNNLLNVIFSGANPSRGGGIYLSGWTDEIPAEIGLAGRSASVQKTALYLVSFDPPILPASQNLRLSAGLFSWAALSDSTSYGASPLGGYINPGEIFSAEFRLSRPVPYQSIQALILHLDGAQLSSIPGSLAYALWDFNRGEWVRQPALDGWGETRIAEPEAYVSRDGVIRIQLTNPSSQSISFNALNFTLEVSR